MNNTTAPLLKKINEYGQLMLSAGLDAGSDFADRHRDGTRKEAEAVELLASITADITKQQASTPQAALPATSDLLAWLIERKASRFGPAVWWAGCGPHFSIDDDHCWTQDANIAIKFSDAQSARHALWTLLRMAHQTARDHRFEVTEHLWPAVAQATPPAAPQIEVWFGSMPESNGRENWTVTLRRKERPGNASPHAIHRLMSGISIYQSEYKDRTRYEADCLRFLLGEIDKEPDILDYDADLHSGYKEPAAAQLHDGSEVYAALQALLDAHQRGRAVSLVGSEGHIASLVERGEAALANAPIAASAQPAVPPPPFLVGQHAEQAAINKPIVQHIMDLARRFRAAPGSDYDVAYKSLEAFVYGVLAGRPLQPSPQSEQSDADEVGVWCRYVAGMVVAHLGGPVDDVRIKPIAGIIQRRLHHLATYGLPSTDKLVHELASCRDAMPRFPETDNEFVESIGDALSVAAYVRATITHIQTGKSWA